ENLQRIGERMEPIVFEGKDVGLGAGLFGIGTHGMGAALRAQLGTKIKTTWEIDQADADALLRGEPLSRSLQSLGYDKEGKAVVCGYGDKQPGRSLTVVDLATRTVTKTIDLEPHRRPHGAAFLPGGKHVVVTSETSQALLFVDLDTGAVVAVPTDAKGSHMVA